MAHLLIVEDDELLRDGLAELTRQAGHQVSTADDGQDALDQLTATRFDGVVLDLGLPKVDGLGVLRSLRRTSPAMPVLILTARDGVDSRVEGLNAGADDYLTKPFNTAELLARLQAMLRRASLPAFDALTPGDTAAQQPRHPQVTALRLDPMLLRAWLGEQAIELTPREWVLLDLLVRQKQQVVSREAVLDAWQAQPIESGAASGALASNALEVYVHRLRRKLAGSAFGIRNIRGLGYMLDTADA